MEKRFTQRALREPLRALRRGYAWGKQFMGDSASTGIIIHAAGVRVALPSSQRQPVRKSLSGRDLKVVSCTHALHASGLSANRPAACGEHRLLTRWDVK